MGCNNSDSKGKSINWKKEKSYRYVKPFHQRFVELENLMEDFLYPRSPQQYSKAKYRTSFNKSQQKNSVTISILFSCVSLYFISISSSKGKQNRKQLLDTHQAVNNDKARTPLCHWHSQINHTKHTLSSWWWRFGKIQRKKKISRLKINLVKE